MKNTSIVFLLIFCCSSILAQPAYNWNVNSDTLSNTAFVKIIADINGNIYACGNLYPPSEKTTLIKYDQFGNLLWQKTDTGFVNYVWTGDLCFGDNGNIYLAGGIKDSNMINKTCLSKYDTNGNLQWQKYYIDPSDTMAGVSSITYFNSFIYTTGRSFDHQLKEKTLVQKYDSLGSLQWAIADTMNNSGEDGGNYISHDNQNIYVSGITDIVSIVQKRMFLAKYDVSGNKIWQQVDNFNSFENQGRKIAIDANNDVYVLVSSNSDFDVVKYDSSGNFLWGNAASPSSQTQSAGYNEIKFDDANDVYLSGNATIAGGIDGLPAFLLTKLNPAGGLIFNYVGQEPGGANSFDFLSQNDIVIIGQLDTLGNRMIDFDSTGNIIWNHLYTNDVAQTSCRTVIVDSMNNIILGGRYNLNPAALEIIKYGNNIFTNTNDVLINASLQFYPNPSNAICKITTPSFSNSTLSLYDLTGRILMQQKFNEQATINVSALKAGMYVVEVRDEKGMSVKGKMIKN